MPIYPDQGVTPDAGDDTLRALLKSLEILNQGGIVASPFPEGTLALSSDDERRAAIKINAALYAGQGGGGGGSYPQTVTAPANITDFSMFSGGVAPTSGVYFAPRDQSTLWTIEGGDSQWTVIDKNSP
jgi:hypothetical protein